MKNRTTALFLIISLASSIIPLALSAEPRGGAEADFYVSTDGDDSWSGILATANKEASDGPFATLSRARDAIRELKKSSAKKDLLVLIRDGTYRLKETILFSLEDSAQADATITYAAYPGETKMQSAIRTDGGQRDTLIAENIIYKCMSQGIILKLGFVPINVSEIGLRDKKFSNNKFAHTRSIKDSL